MAVQRLDLHAQRNYAVPVSAEKFLHLLPFIERKLSLK